MMVVRPVEGDGSKFTVELSIDETIDLYGLTKNPVGDIKVSMETMLERVIQAGISYYQDQKKHNAGSYLKGKPYAIKRRAGRPPKNRNSNQ